MYADSLAAQASRFDLRRDDGLGVMRWLLDLVGDPGTPRWVDGARAHLGENLPVQREAGGPVSEPGGYATPAAFRRALTDRLKALASGSRWP